MFTHEYLELVEIKLERVLKNAALYKVEGTHYLLIENNGDHILRRDSATISNPLEEGEISIQYIYSFNDDFKKLIGYVLRLSPKSDIDIFIDINTKSNICNLIEQITERIKKYEFRVGGEDASIIIP